jgi:hypothetical protein
MGKESAEQEKLYRSFWMTLEKRLPGLLSEFLRDWMQSDRHDSYKVAKEANFKELYSEFKKSTSGREVADLFERFVEFSSAYE